MVSVVRHALPRTSPEQQGIASSAVLQFVEALASQINEVHSFMLLRHGSVVAEGWWSPYAPQHPHMMYSLSKSFTSTAVGLAIAEGCFSLDDPVISFFPDEAPAEVSDYLAAMQVRHLLSMSTGHATDTYIPIMENMQASWVKSFFSVPVVHAPGTHFLYNTGATYMLSAIVQKTTGQKLVDYLQPRLFDLLDIEGATWQESPQGIATGGFGLNIRTEDAARLGQLYLQKGQWHGQQLLAEDWVTEATRPHISNGSAPDSDWTQGYGFQFWRCRHNAYRGDGAFGQYCVVMPDQDAVLAITGGMDDMQDPLNLVWDILLPALSAAPLAEDTSTHQRLTEKLSSLSLPVAQGEASSPLAAQVSGRTFAVDANPLNIETVTLNFTGSDCILTLKTPSDETTIASGYGAWQPGHTALLNNPEDFALYPILASGAWVAEYSYKMVVRLYTTPFFHTFVFHFIGDELLVEKEVNVSFGPLKMQLTGRAG